MKLVKVWESSNGKLYKSKHEAEQADLEHYQILLEADLMTVFGVSNAQDDVISVEDILQRKDRVLEILRRDRALNVSKDSKEVE